MAVTVTYNGVQYSVPEVGNEGWGQTLTDYLVALSSAASAQSQTQTVRTVTSSTAVLATDYAVLCNHAAPMTVTLPTGSTGRIVVVADVSSAGAFVNPITIQGSGGQQIDGSASTVISSQGGSVGLQFDGTRWRTLQRFFASQATVAPSGSNAAFVDAATLSRATFPSAPDLAQATVTLAGTNGFEVLVSLSTGEAMRLFASQASDAINVLSDPSSIALLTDAGTGIFVSKPAASGVLTIKNRMGGSRAIEVRSLTGRITASTAWV